MLPEIWGNCAWKFFHYVTMDYPIDPTDVDKANYYRFFSSIQYVLPCGTCRKNLADHLEKYPLTDEILSSRASLAKWMIDLHNIVNYYTQKPMLSYTEAINKIDSFSQPKNRTEHFSTSSNFNNGNSNNLSNYILIFVLILAICLLIFFLIKRSKKL